MREGRRVKRWGTDPRTGTGHRPKDRLFQVPLYVRVSRLFRCACLVLSLPLCYFIFAYVPLVRDAFRLPSTAHYWPQVKDPERALSSLPRCSVTLVPCIRSIKSAGHMVVCFVTGQMVGDRGFPGATILGVGAFYLLRQPSLSCPADRSRTS